LLESFVETEDSIKMYICITHKQYCDLNTVGNLSASYFLFRELHVFKKKISAKRDKLQTIIRQIYWRNNLHIIAMLL